MNKIYYSILKQKYCQSIYNIWLQMGIFKIENNFIYIIDTNKQGKMITQSKINTETRGRPRKQEARTLSPIFKTMFSDNSAIIHTSFLIYVFEVFVETKNQKRVGHKDGGFTMYDKIDIEYCFDNIQTKLQQWDCLSLLRNQTMKDFVKLLPALGPKIILKQICGLINYIVRSYQQGKSEQQILIEFTEADNQQKLNLLYPYMRFVPQALHELKMDKNQRWDRSSSLQQLVRQRVNDLWEPLSKILIHTIYNCIQGNVSNKYFKPFFSDAQNPSETYIGQLNLDQVVKAVRRQESNERSNRGSQYNIADEQVLDKPRKMRSIIDADGTRAVVQIIKAPQALGAGIVLENSQKSQKAIQSPSNSGIFNKGFTTLLKLKQTQGKQFIKKQSYQNNCGFKSSWKPLEKTQQQLNNSPFKGITFKQHMTIKQQVKKQANDEKLNLKQQQVLLKEQSQNIDQFYNPPPQKKQEEEDQDQEAQNQRQD